MTTERVVFFRPGALGDVLLAFPALALLRKAWPEADVTYVARRDVLPLARANGLADATYAYDLPAWSALFDPGAPSTGGSQGPPARELLLGATVVAWLADPDGAVEHNLYALGAERVVVAPGRPLPGERVHMALQLARALVPLGIAVPGDVETLGALLPPLHANSDVQQRAEVQLATLGRDTSDRTVALHPGSGGAAKRWPAACFAALADILASRGLAPLLIEGPQDAEVCAAVSASSPIPLLVARDLLFGTLAALLARCAGYVGNDSGVSHLAGLAGTPTVALFGPTDPAIWAPLGAHIRALRPPTGALQDLSPEDVADTVSQILGEQIKGEQSA